MPDVAASATPVPPDAEGFTPNGYVEPYPHSDFDGPCVGPCCMGEFYPQPITWTCETRMCFAKLREPGACINCYPPPAVVPELTIIIPEGEREYVMPQPGPGPHQHD